MLPAELFPGWRRKIFRRAQASLLAVYRLADLSADRLRRAVAAGAPAKIGLFDGSGDVIDILLRQLQLSRIDKGVQLLWLSGAADRAADALPRQNPGDGDGRHGNAVPFGDGAQILYKIKSLGINRLMEPIKVGTQGVSRLFKFLHRLTGIFARQNPVLQGSKGDNGSRTSRPPEFRPSSE